MACISTANVSTYLSCFGLDLGHVKEAGISPWKENSTITVTNNTLTTFYNGSPCLCSLLTILV